MLISQIDLGGNHVGVAVRENPGEQAHLVRDATSLHALAMEALDAGKSLAAVVASHGTGDAVDLDKAYAEGRLLSPIHHDDPAHLHLTGTGLTHLGSAASRDAMHQKAAGAAEENLTDSMKMFRMGLEAGKPARGHVGVQPEWFYKGNGNAVTAPGKAIVSPHFAEDAGEEPEIAGIYVISPSGKPFRIGFALSNECSDHVMERRNYLYLAHSKLRSASFGPEIRTGALPGDIHGNSRIIRDGKTIWEKPFVSGEENMSHTIDNLEHHHFKYDIFCVPGDIHVHMFGTATLSFADGVRTKGGDVFEIEARDFGLPLSNPLSLKTGDADRAVEVGVL
ncbi:MAG TPA: AraD1 family protein [Rhizobiaceae bacterium]|nr:AraD1 family protein [Rhizobiaceae bacterium]